MINIPSVSSLYYVNLCCLITLHSWLGLTLVLLLKSVKPQIVQAMFFFVHYSSIMVAMVTHILVALSYAKPLNYSGCLYTHLTIY